MNNTYLTVGTSLRNGQYQINRIISSSEIDVIYEVTDVTLNKKFTLKEFFINRFCQRDEATGQVNSVKPENNALLQKLSDHYFNEGGKVSEINFQGVENIVDTFKEKGTSYIVEESVDGKSLADMLKPGLQLSESVVLDYIMQTAVALKHAHANNCLHLDVRPENIYVDKDGKIRLTNFGVTKQSIENQGINTGIMSIKSRAYAPIEQMGTSSANFSAATDIYSLGATLYFLLSGKKPRSATQRLIGDRLQPLPAGVSDVLKTAVEKSMEMKSSDRPQSIDEFLRLLADLIDIDEALRPVSIEKNKAAGDSVRQKTYGVKEKVKEKEPEINTEYQATVKEAEVRAEASAPVKAPEPRAEVAAPVKAPEPRVEAVAPVKAPESLGEAVAPVKALEQRAEATAPVKAPESRVEAPAPVKTPEPRVEVPAPVKTPEPLAEAAAPVNEAETMIHEVETEARTKTPDGSRINLKKSVDSASVATVKENEGRAEDVAEAPASAEVADITSDISESDNESQDEARADINESKAEDQVSARYVEYQPGDDSSNTRDYQGNPEDNSDSDDEDFGKKGRKKKFIIAFAAAFILIVVGVTVSTLIFSGSANSTETEEISDEDDFAFSAREVSDSTIILDDGTKLIYTGTVNADGQPDGNGNGIYKGEKYVGEYTGEYQDGKRSGKGRFSYHGDDGWNTFEGVFENDGYKKGKLIDERSRAYFVGYFSKGSPYHGTYYTADGKPNGKINKGK